MGNLLRRSCAVHPASGDGGRHVEELPQQRTRSLRIKVRMRRDQLEELLYLARRGDQSDDSGKIGFLKNVWKVAHRRRVLLAPVAMFGLNGVEITQCLEDWIPSQRNNS